MIQYKKKIAVVLASSIDFTNTGMFSVDYAAYNFFKQNFPGCELRFYVFHLSDKKLYENGHLIPYGIYNKISSDNIDEIQNSDLIVYWSDFFHTRNFIEDFMEKYVFEKGLGHEDDVDLYYRAFFLEGCKDSVFKKVVAFGNSMMFLDDKERNKNDRYAMNLRRLYANMVISMPRDILSLGKVCRITDAKYDVGCDPAFLLGKLNRITLKTDEKLIGINIGKRSKIKILDIYIIIKFARKNGMRIQWINWMINQKPFWKSIFSDLSKAKNLILIKLLSTIFQSKRDVNDSGFLELSDYNLIVTDTYHLAINAIREHVPVFCIGNDDIIYNKTDLGLSGEKKKVLFEMAGIRKYFGKPTMSKLSCAYKVSVTPGLILYLNKIKQIEKNLINYCKKILGE